MEWDLGSGLNDVRIENVQVTDGERHVVINNNKTCFYRT